MVLRKTQVFWDVTPSDLNNQRNVVSQTKKCVILKMETHSFGTTVVV